MSHSSDEGSEDEETESKNALVVDNGSSIIKAGFAGDEGPKAIVPAYVGYPKLNKYPHEDSKKHFVGSDAEEMRGVLELRHPIKRGVVTNWEDMEKLWQHTYLAQLRVEPEDHNVMLTEPPLNPTKNREKMTELHFEKFGVPGFYSVIQGVLALHGAGRTTGCVVDSGYGYSHTVPVFKGYTLPHANRIQHLGGSDITEYFGKCMREGGLLDESFSSSADRKVMEAAKEKVAYVALDYEEALKGCSSAGALPASRRSTLIKGQEKGATKEAAAPAEDYTLPDGKVIAISGAARFRCAEPLFQPGLLGMEADGLHSMVLKTIKACDLDIRNDLYRNIVCSGGSTLFKGFSKRLAKELTAGAPAAARVCVIAPPERKYLVFIGASTLANLGFFQSQWILKAEYEEVGATIIHRRCRL